MTVMSSDGKLSTVGDTVLAESLPLSINVLSNEEYGRISVVRIIVGKVGDKAERTAHQFEGDKGFNLQKEVSLDRSGMSYARIEVVTSGSGSYDGKPHFCYTNPIWIDSTP